MRILTVGCSAVHRAMWQDIERAEGGVYVDGIYRKENALLLRLQRAVIELVKRHERKGGWMPPRFMRKFAYACYTLNDAFREAVPGNGESREECWLILPDNRVGWYPMDYFDSIRERYHVRYVLMYLNPYSVSSREVYAFQDRADLVFTYDVRDSERYGFRYFPSVISSSFLEPYRKITPEYDIVFFGGENKRLDTLLACRRRLQESGVHCDFTIAEVPKERRQMEDQIRYCDPVPYEKVLEREARGGTILEVLNGTQSGTTLRALEAVILGRKLLTNNRELVNLPFYDPRYMKIFERPEEIDTEFLRSREPVRYRYHEECSPAKLAEDIRRCSAELPFCV